MLLTIPRGFDLRKPALIVVFFHGIGATLTRDVRDRQQVPRQIVESGLNAVLVAPQFARRRRRSSAGRFWDPACFAQFLDEAADRLDAPARRRRVRAPRSSARRLIAAYSGGYHPLAFALAVGGATQRVRGVFLFDALYGDHDKYLDWLAASRRLLRQHLRPAGEASRTTNSRSISPSAASASPPSFPPHLVPGIVVFMEVGVEVKHHDFVTQAWSADPLKVLLSRIPGYARR